MNPATEQFDRPLAAAVRSLSTRQAEDLAVLDLRGKSTFTDFFVICHGNSERQIKSLIEQVVEDVRVATGRKPLCVEGRPRSQWMLADYGDFVVHVFGAEAREFYRLDRLWGDAPELDPQIVATEG